MSADATTRESGVATLPSARPLTALRERLGASENLWTYLPLIAAIVAIGAYATANSDLFLTSRNIQVLLESVAALGLLTVGMTLLLIAGQLDLSVGAGAALASVVAAKLIVSGASDAVAVAVMLALPAAIGAIVGVLVVRTGVAPFILTLGLLSVLQAVALIQTGQRPVAIGARLQGFDTAKLLGIPLAFWLFVAALIAGSLLLRYTRLGRNAYAVGSNEDAAFLSGVPVGRVKITLFGVSGLLVGLAGLVLLSSLGAGDAASGNGLELQAIAAAVLGGALLTGGRGTMLGSFLGVMLLGVVTNALTLLDVSSFHQRLVQGALLIIAVLATAIAEKRRGAATSLWTPLRRLATGSDHPGSTDTTTTTKAGS
ncbi:MAG: ABC transporter permease [Solirubrobacteraceae bacterium]|nr:ABC transporter permease [Solirubrobacteraceae bacterium]